MIGSDARRLLVVSLLLFKAMKYLSSLGCDGEGVPDDPGRGVSGTTAGVLTVPAFLQSLEFSSHRA